MANPKTKHSAKIKNPKERRLIGKKVLYIGHLICPGCGKAQRKGMASEYNGTYYCSENCVMKVANDPD